MLAIVACTWHSNPDINDEEALRLKDIIINVGLNNVNHAQ